MEMIIENVKGTFEFTFAYLFSEFVTICNKMHSHMYVFIFYLFLSWCALLSSFVDVLVTYNKPSNCSGALEIEQYYISEK